MHENTLKIKHHHTYQVTFHEFAPGGLNAHTIKNCGLGKDTSVIFVDNWDAHCYS